MDKYSYIIAALYSKHLKHRSKPSEQYGALIPVAITPDHLPYPLLASLHPGAYRVNLNL